MPGPGLGALPQCEPCKDGKEIECCQNTEQGNSQPAAKLFTWDCAALLGSTVPLGPVTLYLWTLFHCGVDLEF